MSLAAIEENYLVDLDDEGNRIYGEMREAERTWIEATGFQHVDLGNRTHILVGDSLDLPDHTEMLLTRMAFNEYVKSRLNGKPDTIGNRSTALPVWILPSAKKSIAASLDAADLMPVKEIRVRRQPAFRGAKLSPAQILNHFQGWISLAQRSVESNRRSRHQKRLEQSLDDLEVLLSEQEKVIELLKSAHGNVSARLRTGQSTRIRAVSDAGSWNTTIATVGLFYGPINTEISIITERQRRSRDNCQVPIATIGRLVFYISSEDAKRYQASAGDAAPL